MSKDKIATAPKKTAWRLASDPVAGRAYVRLPMVESLDLQAVLDQVHAETAAPLEKRLGEEVADSATCQRLRTVLRELREARQRVLDLQAQERQLQADRQATEEAAEPGLVNALRQIDGQLEALRAQQADAAKAVAVLSPVYARVEAEARQALLAVAGAEATRQVRAAIAEEDRLLAEFVATSADWFLRWAVAYQIHNHLSPDRATLAVRDLLARLAAG